PRFTSFFFLTHSSCVYTLYPNSRIHNTYIVQRKKRVFKQYTSRAPGWTGGQKTKHVCFLPQRVLDLLFQDTEGEHAFVRWN
ncbi:hypothetical protein NA56DRAFT_690828, partial [Hyaloscypha hepaticicola]